MTAPPVDLAVMQRAVLAQAVDNTTDYSPSVLFHLWESTIVAAVVALLALVLRRHGAHVRYGLWLAASIKFLFPFSILTALGGYAGVLMPPRASGQEPVATNLTVFDSFTVVATPAALTESFTASIAEWVQLVAVGIWVLGAVTFATLRLLAWRRVRVAIRSSTPVELPGVSLPVDVELRSAPGLLEPGVVGWRHPVLLFPANIEQHLTAAELEAVIAHEICHVRRRDNLTAALHMVTETIFWFHPAVWWIGARLLVEREQACDEAVVAGGREPVTYAKAIVNTCALYTASPVSCAAGVTGSNLRRRIETILRNESPAAMRAWAKAAVLITAALVLMVPIGRGMLSAIPLVDVQPVMAFSAGFPPPPESDAQDPARLPAFEVASIKRNTSGTDNSMRNLGANGRMVFNNVPLADLIAAAYGVERFQLVGGDPWIIAERFDVEARSAADDAPTQQNRMLQRLLAERFGLVVRTEVRELPMYRLVKARPDGMLGPGLKRASVDCGPTGRGIGPPPPGSPPGPRPGCVAWFTPAGIRFEGQTIGRLAGVLKMHVREDVRDETGLTGGWNLNISFSPVVGGPVADAAAADSSLPSLFTVLDEQLGLKLERSRSSMDVIVIQRVNQLAEN